MQVAPRKSHTWRDLSVNWCYGGAAKILYSQGVVEAAAGGFALIGYRLSAFAEYEPVVYTVNAVESSDGL